MASKPLRNIIDPAIDIQVQGWVDTGSAWSCNLGVMSLARKVNACLREICCVVDLGIWYKEDYERAEGDLAQKKERENMTGMGWGGEEGMCEGEGGGDKGAHGDQDAVDELVSGS
jgi:hypothetical protein